MSDIRANAAEFFSAIGFDPDSAEYRVLVEAADYYVNHNLPALDDLSGLSTESAAIIAFSFGIGPHNTPGATNTALAAIIKAILDRQRRFAVFAQWEIVDALRDMGTVEDFRAIPRNGYLNTEGVLDQVLEEFERRALKIRTAIVVAQPDHFFRCRRLVEQRGLDVILPGYCLKPPLPWSSYGCDDWGYDPASEQDWTRTRPRFILKELLSLLRTI